jgi:hypothetical protein
MADRKKIHKYRHSANDFHFIPIGTGHYIGTSGSKAIKFLEDLGHKLGLINGELTQFTQVYSRRNIFYWAGY